MDTACFAASAGVGSVGTGCYIVLIEGRDDADPLFLHLKEATTSVLEPYLRRSRFRNHGQRVVEGQRLTQAASDIFLGWTEGPDGPALLLAPAPRCEGHRRPGHDQIAAG